MSQMESEVLLMKVAALEKERDAALADNAEHVRLFRGIQKHTSCDSTAEAVHIHLATPHPGAALLEEHAKALARARNEGLEKAAVFVRAECGPAAAQAIRAMKEPDHG